MPTADEQVIVEGQRARAVVVQNGNMIYSGGATDVQCIVNVNGTAQRAEKVIPIGSDGNPLVVDDALSPTSTNPVQNKVVTDAINANSDAIDVINEELGTNPPWEKPQDWMDIRSGALPNSVYFLVGHSADYATYPTFSLYAKVSNSGTYDVYVDGIKQATTASATATTLDWQTLALPSGFDVTYPQALRTHVVCVTPSVNTNTLTAIRTNGTVQQGILWVHFAINNAIEISAFLNTYDDKRRCPLCEAVTAFGDVIKLSGGSLNGSFRASSLKTIPVLDCNNEAKEMSSCFQGSQLSKIELKNGTGYNWNAFKDCSALKEIKTTNFVADMGANFYEGCSKLNNIAPIVFTKYTYADTTASANLLKGCTSLQPTFLDFSARSDKKRITLGGASNARLDGVKGIVVSNEAPFDNATSPQIDVSYTGLDRGALVNLFNSMPTVTDSQVINVTGATGAADLDATDLAIATAKGWTVTR